MPRRLIKAVIIHNSIIAIILSRPLDSSANSQINDWIRWNILSDHSLVEMPFRPDSFDSCILSAVERDTRYPEKMNVNWY